MLYSQFVADKLVIDYDQGLYFEKECKDVHVSGTVDFEMYDQSHSRKINMQMSNRMVRGSIVGNDDTQCFFPFFKNTLGMN